MERRNPYIVLGVPFGASHDDATKAFSRLTKPLRRSGDAGRAMLTVLTSALKDIEDQPEHPDAAMAPYRVPADPDVAHGEGVFAPPPEPLPPDDPLQTVRVAAAHEFLRHLLRLRADRLDPPAP